MGETRRQDRRFGSRVPSLILTNRTARYATRSGLVEWNMVTLNDDTPLNLRQQRFVDLVCAGVPAGRAYEQAGYTSRGNAAEVGASKLVRNAKVARALEAEREASRERSDLKRGEKLAILADIVRDVGVPARERISAIKAHNDMTGDVGSEKEEARVLPDIAARAREVASALARR